MSSAAENRGAGIGPEAPARLLKPAAWPAAQAALPAALPDSPCAGGNARHTALPRQSCRDLATGDFHFHIKSLGAFFDLQVVPLSSNPDAAASSPERQRLLTRKL